MRGNVQWLVCGGREFKDRALLFEFLDDMVHAFGKPTRVIHGAARGADTFAGEWAKERGVPVKEVPANWNAHGKSAGYIRNEEMLAMLRKGDVVIGFPKGTSPGTHMMIRLARDSKKDIDVYEVPS
jgi:hypothetical protein